MAPLIQRGSNTSPWRIICTTLDLVASCAHRCLVMVGVFISWHDSWLSCGDIDTVFPRLFCLSSV